MHVACIKDLLWCLDIQGKGLLCIYRVIEKREVQFLRIENLRADPEVKMMSSLWACWVYL